ncbi:MAG TPA: helix-turn-helix transcriptional regulator [Chakrabartia sp.]|nr:helix-turn-helix transcriptional regulator [Chakrabartia sp.]
MIRSASDSAAMLSHLRRQLRLAGWTARTLAAELGAGEASVKRWLAGKGLSLDRLDQLAALAGLTLGELARQAERPAPHLAQELTLAQERALSQSAFLSFLFMVILGGTAPDEVAEDFGVPPAQMETALGQLERLALIDRLRGGGVRPLVDRTIVWRKTPMRAQFEERMKPQFMAMDFALPDAVYASDVIKLSDQGAAQLAELIEQHRRDVQALAEQDRHASRLPRRWHAMLCAARPVDTSALEVG